MALSTAARQHLAFMLRSQSFGDEVADVIDAGSGTLSAAARREMDFSIGNHATASGICDAINAGTALSGQQQDRLGIALVSRPIAQEIATALSA